MTNLYKNACAYYNEISNMRILEISYETSNIDPEREKNSIDHIFTHPSMISSINIQIDNLGAIIGNPSIPVTYNSFIDELYDIVIIDKIDFIKDGGEITMYEQSYHKLKNNGLILIHSKKLIDNLSNCLIRKLIYIGFRIEYVNSSDGVIVYARKRSSIIHNI